MQMTYREILRQYEQASEILERLPEEVAGAGSCDRYLQGFRDAEMAADLLATTPDWSEEAGDLGKDRDRALAAARRARAGCKRQIRAYAGKLADLADKIP